MNLQHMQCFSKTNALVCLFCIFILDYFVCVCCPFKAAFSGSFQFGDVSMLDDVIYSFSAKKLTIPLTFHIEKEV